MPCRALGVVLAAAHQQSWSVRVENVQCIDAVGEQDETQSTIHIYVNMIILTR